MTNELQGIVNRLKESIDKSGLSYVELERITKIAMGKPFFGVFCAVF